MPRRTALALCLAATAAVLLVVSVTAFPVWFWDSGNWLNPWGFVAVDAVFPHPFAYLAMALLALGALAVVALRRTGNRVVAAFVSVFTSGAVALAGAGISWVLLDSDGVNRGATRSLAPGGHFEVVVFPGTEFQGPTWTVVARTRDGLFSREHRLAFLEGDNPDCGLGGVGWADGDTVRLTLESGRRYDIRLSPTAVPDRTLSAMYPC